MISLRVAGAVALAGYLISQTVAPALAQDDQQRVPLIMTKLPPQGSALYNAHHQAGRQGQGPGADADQDRDVGGAEGQRRGREEGGGPSMASA